jgi:hypothetical protein
MFLTGNDSIREVLLFPAMKPLDHEVKQQQAAKPAAISHTSVSGK